MFNSILEAVLCHAEATPDKFCLMDDKKRVSYAEYAALIRKYATVFAGMGVKKDSCVVVEAYQSIEFLAFELAIQLAGGIFVPLEFRCSADKFASVAKACDAALIVSVKPIENDEFKHCTHADLVGAVEAAALYDVTLPGPDEISEILFSTGTTGKEKGITLSYVSGVAVAENISEAVDMEDDNIEVIPSPLNHSHGLRSYYANMVKGGGVIVLSNVMDMRRFFDCFGVYGANSLDLVPAALNVILKLSKDKFSEYKDMIRYIEFGSAPMMEIDRNRIKELLPGVPLYNFYGSTESGRTTAYNFNQENCKRGCIGRPTCNTTVIIVDDKRQPIESSKEHTGLLATTGAMNMIGYWRDEAETAAAMENGIIYSNDEAYFDEDGEIILLGRKSDVINIGGKKIAPEEIENAVKTMPGVADCGVIAIPCEGLGNEPMLYVQMAGGQEFDSKAIKEYLGSKLEPFKIPKKMEKIAKIPRTFNGKLLRKELIATYNKSIGKE